MDPTKTLGSFDFAEVPMLSKAHVMALASGDAWVRAPARPLSSLQLLSVCDNDKHGAP